MLSLSRGWAIVREKMEAEIVQAAMQIGKSGGMTTDEIHFRRGSIWAGQQLLELPARLTALIQSQMPFEPAPQDAGDLEKLDPIKAPPLQAAPLRPGKET